MLDIARHFEPPSAVKQLIDQAAEYKINTLHLHVSDDQGFRIAMNGFPNLTQIGSQGSVGTGGRTMDPGGFWTQDEYRSVVAYAAAHFMTVVPDHLGGDEVPSTLLSQDRYAALVNREGGVVNGHGKTVMGWAEIAGSGTALREGSVAEYWNPASGSTSGTITATEAVQKKMKIVMAPANHTYLDQKYASHVPPDLGLTWACGSAGCDVDKFYNWDPGSYVDGVTDAKLIGVEGAMWGETVVTLSDVDYMVFPRLLALAELGWSPLVARTPSGPAYKDFLDRLAAQGARFMTRGTNFYPSPKVPWRLALVAAHPTVSNGQVSGALAMLSAPGVAAGAVTASIDWGDGTTTPGTVTGTAATPATVNGLYAIGGDHLYTMSGTHHATVTVTAPGVAPAAVRITLPA